MVIGRVIGHVWATKKEEALSGMKLMIIQGIDPTGVCEEKSFVAVDVVGAGIGEDVLVVSGSTARQVFGNDHVPIDAAIVGIIDTIEVEDHQDRKV